ncbi:MAG TPA: peptidase S8, partial [Thermoplasmatales archaeon]|nr:peptidase S8 [Thermoplasmatales archaeon]
LIVTKIPLLDVLDAKYHVKSIEPLFPVEEKSNRISIPSGISNIYRLTFSSDMDIKLVLSAYSLLSDVVEYVEPDYEIQTCVYLYEGDDPENGTIPYNGTDSDTGIEYPNDPGFEVQWHLHGPDEGGIEVVPAWQISTGKGTIVAVLDTGVGDLYECHVHKHPYCSEDFNETCFVQGYNFVKENPQTGDDNGHGTHVAGTIAESTNNGIGVCGVAPDACIMPIKVFNYRGEGYVSDVAEGIYYATLYGANIISMSFGMPYDSSALREAVNFAYQNGVTLVASAGNTGGPGLMYPAAYSCVISVGATQYDKTRAFYSTFGQNLDVVAPGGNLRLDQNNDGYPDGILQETNPLGIPVSGCSCGGRGWGYYFLMGTSMACPHVSGIAALLYSIGITDPREIKERICDTAIDLGQEGKDAFYGYGLVNAYRAVEAPFKPSDPYPADESRDVGIDINLSVYVRDPNDELLNVSFYCTGIYPYRPGVKEEKIEEPILIGRVANVTSGSRVSVRWSNLSEYTGYSWFVIVDDGDTEIKSDVFHFRTGVVNDPPFIPSDPYPMNGLTGVSTNVVLSFNGGDPDPYDNITYKLWFGTDENPPFYGVIGSYPPDTARIAYAVGKLENNTRYYWKVVAEDSGGLISESPIWSFVTFNPHGNNLPYAPYNPNPHDGETDIDLNTILTWSSGDPDGDTLTYDIYFGTSNPPPKVATDIDINHYNPGTLQPHTTYYWKVVARDAKGSESEGTIWHFTTTSFINVTENTPPYPPDNPYPEDGAVNVSVDTVLSWSGGDPDGDMVTYAIYLGKTTSPPLVASNLSTTHYNPPVLDYNTTYYWRVIARDSYGLTTEGELWAFTTSGFSSGGGENTSYDIPDVALIPKFICINNLSIGVKNEGEYLLSSLEWTIRIKGGLLGLIDITSDGMIEDIQPNEIIEISTDGKPIFGLG